MIIQEYRIDTFTQGAFTGNPAAVCVLDDMIPEADYQNIARENNYPETAFIVFIEQGIYQLRWFTLKGESELCGHSTLAAAHVVFRYLDPSLDHIVFSTKSGEIIVRRTGDLIEIELLAESPKRIPVTPEMEAAFGAKPSDAWLGRDLLCVFDSESAVRALKPRTEALAGLPGLLQHASAPGDRADCATRTFAPKIGVPEDPVSGSGQCLLAPYWSERLGKDTVTTVLAGPRKGRVSCRLHEDKAGRKLVSVAGAVSLFSIDRVYVNI